MNRNLFIIILILSLPYKVYASEDILLSPVSINLHNQPSLQRGAKIFVNNCMGCHTLKHQRYSKLINPLGMTKEMIEKNLIFTTDERGAPTKIGSLMINSVDVDSSKEAFGVAPPDLTLIARSRGPDWVYTFLLSFYKDDTRPLGVNNSIYPNVSMPHVLWWMEGIKEPVDNNLEEYKYIVVGSLNEKEYKQSITDLVNFLTYVSEPAQLERYKIGFWVLLFLTLFAFVSYLLKREYWKDVE